MYVAKETKKGQTLNLSKLLYKKINDLQQIMIMIVVVFTYLIFKAEKYNNGATSVTAKLSKGQVVEAQLTQGTVYGGSDMSSFQGFQI